MKLLSKSIIWGIFAVLVVVNIFIFVNSIGLSDNINKFESDTKTLHQENLNLENEVYQIDSLQYAASVAASLNFSQKAQPIFLENLKYALNR